MSMGVCTVHVCVTVLVTYGNFAMCVGSLSSILYPGSYVFDWAIATQDAGKACLAFSRQGLVCAWLVSCSNNGPAQSSSFRRIWRTSLWAE